MCTEIPLNELLAIDAVPVADMTVQAQYVLADTLPESGVTVVKQNLIRIAAGAAGAKMIPLNPSERGKLKDDERDALPGRSHTITVDADINDLAATTRAAMRILERHPHSLLLSFRDGREAIVVTNPDSYVCTTTRDGSRTTINIRIQNVVGVQWYTS